MPTENLIHALVLGITEGLTEFIPVSSTGHLILLGNLLGFQGPPGKVFEVAIQLGAILAVCVVYFQRLWGVASRLHRDPGARRFALAIILGFLPAMAVGAVAHGFIKSVLFQPVVVCVSLIVGGVIIIVIERYLPKARFHEVEGFPNSVALRIGAFQCLALIPGVSRSGATIIGGLLMGVDRRAAAEFSFFVAIPTMVAATAYDLYKNWGGMTLDGGVLIAVGFIAAFVAGVVVVRGILSFIGRYGFQPFGWYRIAVGILMLTWFYG